MNRPLQRESQGECGYTAEFPPLMGELLAFRKPDGENQDDKVHQEVIRRTSSIYTFFISLTRAQYILSLSKGVELWHEKKRAKWRKCKNEGEK